MDSFIQIISTSAVTGFLTATLTIGFTRKNLKTTKYIETITTERIKWIQVVRTDLTELVSSIMIHLKNTDYLIGIENRKISQNYTNYVVSREPDSYSDDELQDYYDLQRNIEQTENDLKSVLTRSRIVQKATLLKLRFNPNEDIDIINLLNLIIEDF
ncbi:MAG: hypothetical protein GXO47_13795, partial [Chlorobi bacterium]|nr:hypothetical protein [Chlorobiota bacterium]